MLDNIKSYFFIKKLFYNLEEGRKLKVAKYNKRLQKNLDLNLINYMTFTNKYIIYDENGKGKEYDRPNEVLLYEGEFKNGERYGKGKEYHFRNINLMYEGEYKNGKRHGKGKEYDNEGNIIFEGECLNGNPWNGKLYKKNNIQFELKDGKGFIDTEYFKGEIKNGEINGQGKEYDFLTDQLLFEGEYVNGKKWNGKGYINNKQIIYELKDGKGYFKKYYCNKLRFEGEYLRGEINGKGKEYDYDGNLEFEGDYINGKKNGKGKEYDRDGKLKFEGDYINGKRNGKGKEYDRDGKLKFIGEYLYGNKRKGKSYIKGILEYEGEYLFDKKWNGKGFDKNNNILYELKEGNGYVKEYDNTDNLIFEGKYLNGKKEWERKRI